MTKSEAELNGFCQAILSISHTLIRIRDRKYPTAVITVSDQIQAQAQAFHIHDARTWHLTATAS